MRQQLPAILFAALLLANTLPVIFGTAEFADPLIKRAFAQIQDASITAQASPSPQTPQLIERGRDYERYDLGNGALKLIAGLPPWTYDFDQGRYVNHKITDYGNSTVKVQSGMIAWRIGPDSSTIYDANATQVRATETWQLYVAGVPVQKTFQYQTVFENSTMVSVTNQYGLSYQNLSFIKIFIQNAIYDGRPTERNVIITGLPDAAKPFVKLERQWTGIDADAVQNDGTQDTITTTLKTKVQDGSGQFTRFMKSGKVVLHENLRTAGSKLSDVQYQSTLAKFNYAGWQSTDTSLLLKDDTFSSSSPTQDGWVQTTNGAIGTSCPGSPYSRGTTDQSIRAYKGASSSTDICIRGYIQWDTTSISDSATISSTVVKFEVRNVGSAVNCDWTPIGAKPSTATDANLWTDIGDGTAYISNDATCTTTGTNKSLTLGSSANTDLTNLLSANWFAVGYKFNSETRDGTGRNAYLAASEASAPTPAPTLEVTYTVPVTQPITCTMDNSGTQQTLTLSGGSPSPSTVACDGASHNITVNPSVTLTATEPSDGANTRARFSGGGTTTNTTTCASGTCTAWTFTNYYELQNTYQASTNGQGPPTWDASLSAALTGTLAGAGSTTICTISPTSGTTTNGSCSGWADYNLAVSYPATFSGAGANIQWARAGASSVSSTTGGNTYVVAHYKQLSNTYQAAPAGNRATFDAVMTISVTGTSLGTGSSTLCTISTSIGGGTASCTGWGDYNKATTTDYIKTISSTERWIDSVYLGSSWTQTTGGNTNTASYYNQFGPTLTLSGLGSQTVTVTYTAGGSTQTPTQGNGSVQYYIDYNTNWSVPVSITVNSTLTYSTSDTRTWTQTDATNRSVTYIAQQSRPVSQTITTSDSGARTLLAARSDSETVSTSAAVATMYAAQRSAAESAVISPAVARVLAAGRSASDSFTPSDTITINITKPVSETVTTSDAGARTLLAQRTDAETLSVSPAVVATAVYAVTQPITLTNGAGTSTFETDGTYATITCTYGGTHDGNPAQQNFVCLQNETVAVSLPSSTATMKYVWSDGTTANKTFAACNSGTCPDQSFTYYQQFKQTVTLSGFDASRSTTITRTQQGSAGTSSISGSTATAIWADKGTSFVIPSTITIVSAEQRFQSYNSTSVLSYSITGANTKVIVYQNEYNILYRVNEEHRGYIFAPMPKGIYSSTVTLANGTQMSLTYDTQITDDYLQPAAGRVWSKNGTTTVSNVTWRGQIVNASSIQSITAYGNLDVVAASKHYGFAPDRHFRLDVDSGTIDKDSVSFSFDTAVMQFDGSASAGTHSVKVEYLRLLYQGVSDVKVNGTSLDINSYSVADDTSLSPVVSVLTIPSVTFGTGPTTIRITLVANPASGGPAAGGGGGGGGGGGSSVFVNPGGIALPGLTNPSVGQSLHLSVTADPVNVVEGKASDPPIMIKVRWEGATSLRIEKIEFLSHPEWFTVLQPLPATFTPMSNSANELVATIPVVVTVPPGQANSGQGRDLAVQAKVSASAGVSQEAATIPLQIGLASSGNIALVILLALAATGGGAMVFNARKGGRKGKRRGGGGSKR